MSSRVFNKEYNVDKEGADALFLDLRSSLYKSLLNSDSFIYIGRGGESGELDFHHLNNSITFVGDKCFRLFSSSQENLDECKRDLEKEISPLRLVLRHEGLSN